jgi:hypothetical protein
VSILGDGSGRRARTGADGSFHLEPVGGGAVEYEARCGPLRAVAPSGEDGVEIRLPPAFELAGRVVTEAGGPVAGARVSCGGRGTASDDRGRFRLAAIPAPDGLPPPLEVAAEGFRTLRTDWSGQGAGGEEVAWDDLWLRLLRR